MTRFIDAHRERFAVAEMCRVLGWNPSTYYAYKSRPPSDRALRDEDLKAEIVRVWEANYKVYGFRKVWQQLRREHIDVARCTVQRLMREMGLAGVTRGGKKRKTTHADLEAVRPPDLLKRDFTAGAPNRRWVADITYVPTRQGFVHVAFVIDLFSRMIVGWALASHLRTELPLEALEMAIWRRDTTDLAGLIHHSDAGSQYTSISYGDRLDDAGIAPSIGSVGDSYDNAQAESTIGLYKTELIDHHGPWHTRVQTELATLGYINWFNRARLHGELNYLTPAEYEEDYYRRTHPGLVEATTQR